MYLILSLWRETREKNISVLYNFFFDNKDNFP